MGLRWSSQDDISKAGGKEKNKERLCLTTQSFGAHDVTYIYTLFLKTLLMTI